MREGSTCEQRRWWDRRAPELQISEGLQGVLGDTEDMAEIQGRGS